MTSGVKVSDLCKSMFGQVKMTRQGQKKKRFAVFKISDDFKQIIPDEGRDDEGEGCGNPEHFDDIVRDLPQDDGRYIVYDYPYEANHGMSSKVIFVMWVPEGITIKKKMLYASSKDALKKCIEFGAELQADCPGDLCHDDIRAKLRKV